MAQQNVKPNGYRPRIVDKQIEQYMRIFGAVEIAGTKWCGKTWAARAHANSITYVDRDNNLPMAQADPSLMLLGDRPHVIDEWAIAPAIWDEIRQRSTMSPAAKASGCSPALPLHKRTPARSIPELGESDASA